jgi:DNA-binding GntR family transcriptional regulator
VPIEISSLDVRVFRDRIEQAILKSLSNGDLKPGDQVNEADIARQAGISRGPVREAIQHLVGEEILVSYPHRGTFVAEWAEKDIREVYNIRALLEGFAARLAVKNMTTEELTELSSLIEKMVNKAREGDEASVFEFDLLFHLRVYEFSRHELLCRLLTNLHRRIYIFIKFDADTTPSLVTYAENHYKLLDSLKLQNSDQAEAVFREHIETVGEALAERHRIKRLEQQDTSVKKNGRHL